jgi:heparan-alpha-glucosaminide N-acetyltransferase
MSDSKPINSIAVMKGFTLLLMIFFNDLRWTGVPSWLGSANADYDGMGLADWAFPGFLFVVGMSVPSLLSLKFSEGKRNIDIAKLILKRSLALIIIGVLMINAGRVNEEFTGFGRNIWALLMYAGIFLIWYDYKENDKNFFTVAGLKLLGMALLVFLVFRFRSGEFANNGSLIPAWWGIMGLTGWGYLVAAMVFLAIRNDILNTVVAFLFFLAMNILSSLGLLTSIDLVKPFLGVIIEGSVPMIVLSGMLLTQIVSKYPKAAYTKTVLIILSLGIGNLAAGFILRNWIIISRIQTTPSWGLICNGISIILFALLFWLIDIKEKAPWTRFLKPAGENPITTYLVPDILYYLILLTGVPVLFYKQSSIPALLIAGSILWALLMLWLASKLTKIGAKLKL